MIKELFKERQEERKQLEEITEDSLEKQVENLENIISETISFYDRVVSQCIEIALNGDTSCKHTKRIEYYQRHLLSPHQLPRQIKIEIKNADEWGCEEDRIVVLYNSFLALLKHGPYSNFFESVSVDEHLGEFTVTFSRESFIKLEETLKNEKDKEENTAQNFRDKVSNIDDEEIRQIEETTDEEKLESIYYDILSQMIDKTLENAKKYGKEYETKISIPVKTTFKTIEINGVIYPLDAFLSLMRNGKYSCLFLSVTLKTIAPDKPVLTFTSNLEGIKNVKSMIVEESKQKGKQKTITKPLINYQGGI